MTARLFKMAVPTLLFAAHACAGETLYNGIVLPDAWLHITEQQAARRGTWETLMKMGMWKLLILE